MSSDDARTIAALWQRAVTAERRVAAYLVDDGDSWHEVSWAEAAARVDELAHGLLELGIKKGDRFAILGSTRVEWALLDFALCSIGAVVVPLYPTSSGNECAYILADADVSAVAVEDEAQREKIEEVRGQVPRLEELLGFDELDRLAERGRAHRDRFPNAVAEAAAAIVEDDLLTCIYTSGTTGPPKGCVLTNHNYVAMTEMICGVDLMRPGDRTVLFLPLAHGFGRLVHFAAARTGFTLAFCPAVSDLGRAFEQVRPHFFPAVPRVYEKLHATVREELQAATGIKRPVVQWALAVGKRTSGYRQERRSLPWLLALQHALADRIVFSKVKTKLGGSLRFAVSGGAPTAREILEFFHALDITILEGYGLTECTSCSINRLDRFRFGTVGPPLPGCEISFDEDGEILVGGPHVFSGYLNKEEATRETFTDDGRFRTGDIGELDPDGFLRITDRKKDLIATAGGKKIAPQNIENDLKRRSKLISHALVVGDRRPYIVALVTLDPDEFAHWAHTRGYNGDLPGLAASDEIRGVVQPIVDEVNRELSRPEQIKRFAVLQRDFSEEEGEITPTLKLKRRICEQHFAAEIEQLYGAPA
jgi:long-chain acyl-CoA synthetase